MGEGLKYTGSFIPPTSEGNLNARSKLSMWGAPMEPGRSSRKRIMDASYIGCNIPIAGARRGLGLFMLGRSDRAGGRGAPLLRAVVNVGTALAATSAVVITFRPASRQLGDHH